MSTNERHLWMMRPESHIMMMHFPVFGRRLRLQCHKTAGMSFER